MLNDMWFIIPANSVFVIEISLTFVHQNKFDSEEGISIPMPTTHTTDNQKFTMTTIKKKI
jgi:hypothetical protein